MSQKLASETAPRGAPPERFSPAVSTVLRRALLTCGGDLDALQNHLDAAELLWSVGLAAEARLLYEVTFLRQGFSASRRREQATIAACTKLWEDLEGTAMTDTTAAAGPMIDRAVAELAVLMPLATAGLPATGPEQFAVLAGAVPGGAPDLSGIADLTGALFHALRDFAGNLDELATLTERLQADVLGRTPFDLAGACNCSVQHFTRNLAFNSLRRFARAIAALAAPPFGAPALLAAAARLDTQGLGPYFANVPRIASGRDLLGLIQLAGGGEAVDVDRLERWSVLTAVGHRDEALHALVDDLADIGLMRPLWAILAGVERGPERPDRVLLWRIRDAGLDRGDLALAFEAQAVLATAWPRDMVEQVILGDIEGTRRDLPAAERIFEAVFRSDPGHAGARARLAALRADDFSPFLLTAGLGSSPDRRAGRARRRIAQTGRLDKAR